jgi:hypothetical protein
MPNKARVATFDRNAFEHPRVTGVPASFPRRNSADLKVVGNHIVSRLPNVFDQDIFDIRVLPPGPEALPPLFRHT